MVRALALRSGYPGFKTRFDHSLIFFLVVPCSTSQLHLFASAQLGFLTVVVVVVFFRFINCVLVLKSSYVERSIKCVLHSIVTFKNYLQGSRYCLCP